MVVGNLTRFAHFSDIPYDYSVAHVVEIFFKDIFWVHGPPKNIVSDRDNRFMRGFWQEIFHLVSTDLTPSTSYNPRLMGK